jgi:Phosphopantetheine attachment site
MTQPAGPAAAHSDQMPAAEQALAEMERVLRAMFGRPIRPDENFFDAGLTSATLAQLHEVSTRGWGDPFPVTAMFAYPNLGALRRYVAGQEWAAPELPDYAAAGTRLRRIGSARRQLRKQIRSESELS